jgi:hypothetical protein
MNLRLLFSFVFLIIMVVVMQKQGHVLVTPASNHGILDLEFARNGGRLKQLSLFWNPHDVRMNIYLDFVFILAYTLFFVTACNWIRIKKGWIKVSQTFTGIAVAAGLFDICENFLMLMVMNGRFDPWVLQIVFYCAAIKFIFAGAVILFILASFFIRSKQKTIQS